MFLPILALICALPPLLTIAWLWQLKEWRWDRLLEHLRREGWIWQLWGRARPGIATVYLLWLIFPYGAAAINAPLLALLMLTALTVVQIALRRQRIPVFTKKALTVTCTAGFLTVAIAFLLTWNGLPVLLPFLVLLQPAMLTIAWAACHPVDAVLKNRIIARARSLRERHPELMVVGVAGSVGKTTTKELIACVLHDLHPAVTPEYMNSEIGVARWLNAQLPMLQSTLIIVEMGAYRTGEIATMCSFTQPTIGVVTHVGMQHIALFGSQEKLFEAKSELVRSLPSDGRVFLNGDNESARRMATVSPCPIVIVGTGGRCDLEAFDIEETSNGIRFRASDVSFEVPLRGTHNVTNALLAIAVGEHLGIRLERMRELLKTFSASSKTFSVRAEMGVRILDDTHNSSAASMKAAIAWARTQPEEHKILLASGLIEMGDLQSPAEEELGSLAAKVFERMIVLDAVSAKNFARGGAAVEVIAKKSVLVPPGSLLICVGRMSQATIRNMLPR